MFKKVGFLTFCLFVMLSTHLCAGWPEDGWEGVPSLRFIHKGHPISFDQLHQLLATEEEKAARILPSNTPTNIVLASISLLGGGEIPSLHTYYLQSSESKWLVFESGWDSSFSSNPVHEEAQKLMKTYAPKLQKGDSLTLLDKEQLVQSCIKVAQSQRYFEEQITPNFYFFDQEFIPIESILARIERVFFESEPNSSDVSHAVHRDLIKNRAAFDRVASDLQTAKLEAAKSISMMSQEINLCSGINLDFIKDLDRSVKYAHNQISVREKEMSSLGSKVISTYWHSEQKFLKYIEDEMPHILADMFKESLPFKPEAVFINVHSRHDICPVCSHTFVRSYTRPEGVLSVFRDALCKRLEIDSQAIPLYMTSSFREKREKTKYAVREDRPEILEDSVAKLYPAFPTLYIPLSSHEHSQSPVSSSSSNSSLSSSSSSSTGSR
jgi:hypothetical protein